MRRSPPILALSVGLLSMACTAEPKLGSGDNAPTSLGDSTSEILAVAVTVPGEPLPGLENKQRQVFDQGVQVFATPFTAATGLGPLFNSNSCASCHDDPALGGYGDSVEVHVTAYHPGAACDVLSANGGPVVQQHVTPELAAALGISKEPTPAGATATALRSTPLIFGLGLMDAVSDRTIRALSRIRYRDGVHGRPAILPDGRVGRFGRKASVASLDEFNAGAFFNEMGVTNPLNPVEGTVAGQPLLPGVDLAPDPELDAASLTATNTFVKLLGPVSPAALTPDTHFGRALFYQVGCTNCHLPVLRTDFSPIPALRYRWFRAYTDLLLHDMGPDNADICNGVATPSEFRTKPLIGMQFLDMFMHDGLATTVQEAIQRHGGEGSAARDKYNALDQRGQAALVAFVRSL